MRGRCHQSKKRSDNEKIPNFPVVRGLRKIQIPNSLDEVGREGRYNFNLLYYLIDPWKAE